MNRGLLWTILGVIAAIVIAWFIVDIALKAVFFIAKLAVVAVVALIVFLLLRWVFRRRDA
ncbi:putative flippase GtrA [Microbacterium marinum]|uniref:Putative flippase GtrA n=1 Tax=Microbacterium marinum TaxID=421115 RepID=A0A7W7BSL8_9MICO|nr:hypothetical protein [Microbacterium marinum]MBB4668082.1 putative flippase GtrA [Microbacterium marinum]HCJ49152.1 hypothetical protein [Microbacterium sp.]